MHAITIIVWSHFKNFVQKINEYLVILLNIFYYKIQHRGSEYDHGLLWIENAPIYGFAPDATFEKFIDQHFSCYNHILTLKFCEALIHRHNKTCRKNNQVVCRFNYPWPPMEETKNLNPLSESISFIDKTSLNYINT